MAGQLEEGGGSHAGALPASRADDALSQQQNRHYAGADEDLEYGTWHAAVTESSALLGSDSEDTRYDTSPAEPEALDQKKGGDWDDLPALGDPSWRREAKIILVSAGPLITTFFLQYSINATSVFAVGRIGKTELGAVALANMTAAMTCLAPLIGLATSLDTLCTQAYGEGRKHLVGLQCQRNALFLLTFSVPVIILWIFSEPILAQIVDAEAARLASMYLKVMVFMIPGVIVYESGKRLLQAQGLFRETTYVILIVAPINIFINWLLVWKLGLGFIGAPIGVVISRNMLAVLLILYIKFIKGSQCWGGFDKRAFTNWGVMIKLALPGMVMVMAEWLAFEIMTLISSRFGTDVLAAQSAIFTLVGALYQIPFSMSVASSTRIGSLVGGGIIDSAKLASELAVISVSGISALNVTLCVALRWYLPLLFTRDEDVIVIIAKTLPVVALAVFWDGVSAGAHGILRGVGMQSIGGPANIFAHYVVAIPVGIALAFDFDWNVRGLWVGITAGLITASAIEYYYILRIDWQKAALESRARNALG